LKKFLFLMLILLPAISLVVAGCSQTQTQTQPQSEQKQGAQAPAAKEEAKKKVDYPTKPIELVVPSTAGGGTDVVARAVANGAKKYLPNGQSIVIVNKPGAGATLGIAEVFTAKPDGYKIGAVSTGPLSIQPNYGQTPYKHDSFIPIAQWTSSQNVLVVKADAPWKTYAEWLDYVKKNPGSFNYGTGGAGNTQHLAMEALNILEQIQTKHVPFEGGGPALTALLGGHIQGAIVSVQESKPHTDSGKLKVIANLGTSKTDTYKDAAFLKDKGFAGFDVWTGLVVPKDTPKEIVDILSDAFKKAMADQEVKDQIVKFGIDPAYADSEGFKKIINETAVSTNEVAKKIGLSK
jgi:tripartite-type tricarboxylate transporter receptor subunit TctC